MNIFIAAILKIVLLEAFIALLWVTFFFDRTPKTRRALSVGFITLGLLSALAYFNFGFLRGEREALIHAHEQFHFVLGSKYLHEVRYDGLYEAADLVLREQRGQGAREIRDPMTFRLKAPDPVPEVRARFSDARWAGFTEDVAFYLQGARRLGGACQQAPPTCPPDQICREGRCAPGPWQVSARVMSDHGNTGSPAWAMIASLFTRSVTLTPQIARLFGGLDVILMVILFLTIGLTFGPRVAGIAALFTLLPLHAYDWLGGSLLRLDWLFAAGLSVSLYHQKRYRLAGLLLGYAVITKLFVGLMALGLGIHFIAEAMRARRIERGHAELVGFALLGVGLAVGLSAGYYGGLRIWDDYIQRILVTFHEKYYNSQYSLRDVALQLQHQGWRALLNPAPSAPLAIAAARPEIHARDFILGLSLLRGGFALGIIIWIARARDGVQAFGAGVLLIYIALITNIYYWQMFGLLALGLARAPLRWGNLLGLTGLALLLMAEYLFVHLAGLRHALGYFGSYLLALGLALLTLTQLILLGQALLRRSMAPPVTLEPPTVHLG
ncbi:hypothetical protein KKB55_01750 [Myxococcota bacterium]|nr:hypothetical protein [Myxococcota bacterium]